MHRPHRRLDSSPPGIPRTEDQGPMTKDKGPRTQDQGPWTLGPRTKDQGPRIKDQGSRIKDQGPRTKDQGPRSKDQVLVPVLVLVLYSTVRSPAQTGPRGQKLAFQRFEPIILRNLLWRFRNTTLEKHSSKPMMVYEYITCFIKNRNFSDLFLTSESIF